MRLTRLLVTAALLMLGLALSTGVAQAHGGGHQYHPPDLPALKDPAATGVEPAGAASTFDLAPAAACPGGPTIDGILLDECVVRSFVIDGTTKSVTVWYTKNPVTATRMVDGSPVVLSHWINTDAQAQQVAAWFENAWRRYHTDSGHHLYDTGCSNNVNVQMEDGVGWSGIAYWGSSGNCNIGIDSPMVRGGGGEWTVYHEAQHYLQYSWDDGCYGYLKPNYPDDSEFVEGYADLGADSVNATVDAAGYAGIGYNNHTSMYDKSYGNLFLKYFIEQLGDYATPADPWHNIDAMYAHYDECDAKDTLYVLDSLIPALSGGALSMNEFFLNFFAANWAKDWADPVTQEELIYYDDDASPYDPPTLTQNVNMNGGSQAWSDSTPDDFAARYYQITPQSGCPYLQMEVDGEAGALLGINFMAAQTSAPTSVLRSAYIGNGYVRTFAANGVHDRLVTVVNSFTNNYSYDVTATCIAPALNILEPKQTAFAMVGAPDSPIAFLARWEVTDGTAGVRGLQESDFSFDVEGDAATLVSGTFQAVGDEYWAVLIPPVKPAGTTFADLQICLDGAICDSENNALLYVDPGKTDIAMVFDGSGSMAEEDITGEGTRLENAQHAGLVIANLLRPDDRILITDFSAKDNPVGCGTESGGYTCELDIITRLSRRDVPAPPDATIANARDAINQTTAREWTPIGPALDHAKDELLKEPGSLNPKHIFLLSDGEENVKPFYADIKSDLINSGVVINTIGFGPEAPGNLLAQIAADTGGVYRPVPTTPSGASVAAASMPANVPAEVAAIMAAPVAPGQLGLADVYDYFDTEAQDATRVFQKNFNVTTELSCVWAEQYIHVDKSANQLRFVLSAKQEEETGAWHRYTKVQPPSGLGRKGQWYDISPANNDPPPPANWIIRNDGFNDVLIVPNPDAGEWGFRSCTVPAIIIDAASTPDAPAASDTNFMMAVSLQSEIQLQGRILGLNSNQGVAGDVVTILGYLLSREGLLPASTMTARVVSGGGTSMLPMFDDGLHNDGEAGDGIYGVLYPQTYTGGGYDVKIMATLPDPNQPSATIMREWNGGFWIKGPRPDIKDTDEREDRDQDKDGDGMPDDWEVRCKLNPDDPNDTKLDPDRDGLPNLAEWQYGTLPCDADTDNGGENDGSEVRNGRDPLNPKDDVVIPLVKVKLRPLNSRVLINWSPVISNVNVLLYISTDINDPGKPTEMGDKGNYLVENLQNDTTYYVWLQPEMGTALGPLTQPEAVTPKADPDAPAGSVLIEDGAPTTKSKQVTLNLTSTDEPLDGAAQAANAHQTDMLSTLYNTVSGNIEMRISNAADLAGATWEPLSQFKEWTLDCEVGEICRVYAQFRDQVGNESLIISDEILLEEGDGPSPSTSDIFLPLLATP